MTKKSKPAPISPEQATAILQIEQNKRTKAFEEAYQRLCKKYGCDIQARPGITEDGRIGTTLLVVLNAKPAEDDGVIADRLAAICED